MSVLLLSKMVMIIVLFVENSELLTCFRAEETKRSQLSYKEFSIKPFLSEADCSQLIKNSHFDRYFISGFGFQVNFTETDILESGIDKISCFAFVKN